MNWFRSPSGDAWFSVGLASSFPDIGLDEVDGDLSQPRPCNSRDKPGCKIFHVPAANSSQRTEVSVTEGETSSEEELKDQVLVFQYRGKFHAVDHVSAPFHKAQVLNQANSVPQEMSSLILSPVKGHSVRYRGLWRRSQCRTDMSQARLVLRPLHWNG
jgi:hypothetical protein